MGGNFGLARDNNVHFEEHLPAGTYAVFSEIEWNESKACEKQTYAVVRYGEGDAEWEDCTH